MVDLWPLRRDVRILFDFSVAITCPSLSNPVGGVINRLKKKKLVMMQFEIKYS